MNYIISDSKYDILKESNITQYQKKKMARINKEINIYICIACPVYDNYENLYFINDR